MSDLPSQIPRPTNKRSSLNFSSTILQNSTYPNTVGAGPSRASSPLTIPGKGLVNGVGGRISPAGRRGSLLNGGVGGKEDDPAQLTLLQSALRHTQQTNLDLMARLTLGESGRSGAESPGLLSPRLVSPGVSPVLGSRGEANGSVLGLGMGEGVLEEEVGEEQPVRNEDEDVGVEMEMVSRGGVEDGERVVEEGDGVDGGVMENGVDDYLVSNGIAKPRLPHSDPSYDLRSRAVTPGKSPGGDRGIGRIPTSSVPLTMSLHPTPPRQITNHHLTPTPNLIPRTSFSNTSNYHPNPINPNETPELRSPFPFPDHLSPSLRKPSAGGSAASTKVIDNLQTELLATKGYLERARQEVRGAQRHIGQLTRQTEDLKETRERMRMECEGLNNVVARKERLLQEVLDRARTAESDLNLLKAEKKSLEQTTKKSISAMTVQLSEAQAGTIKAEREERALRESLKSLREVWGREVKGFREEVRRGDERVLEANKNNQALIKLVQAQSKERDEIQSLAQESISQSKTADEKFRIEIEGLKSEVEKRRSEVTESRAVAGELASELIRLRRLMRAPRREDLEEIVAGTQSRSDEGAGEVDRDEVSVLPVVA